MSTVEYWKHSALDDFSAAEALFAAKKYHQALFFVHLSIEKALKALYVSKRNEPAIPIHDLNRLAHGIPITINEQQAKELVEISRFNISARYEDQKHALYKKATRDFSQKWMMKGETILTWFLSLL